MRFELVPAEWTARLWPEVEQYVAMAQEFSSDEYTVDQVKTLVLTGVWNLLVATEENKLCGAVVMSVSNRPNDRAAFIVTMGGKNIVSVDSINQIKEIAVTLGATVLEGAVRDSVARLAVKVGFTEKCKLVVINLKE
jgi:uncharacterized membrane protein YiaA